MFVVYVYIYHEAFNIKQQINMMFRADSSMFYTAVAARACFYTFDRPSETVGRTPGAELDLLLVLLRASLLPDFGWAGCQKVRWTFISI